MLTDARRHTLFQLAIQGAVGRLQATRGDGETVRVLDVGTGTGLLSLEAARAGASVVACEGFPAVAAVAQEVVAAARLEGACIRVCVCVCACAGCGAGGGGDDALTNACLV
jgi:predicted RNA methylase